MNCNCINPSRLRIAGDSSRYHITMSYLFFLENDSSLMIDEDCHGDFYLFLGSYFRNLEIIALFKLKTEQLSPQFYRLIKSPTEKSLALIKMNGVFHDQGNYYSISKNTIPLLKSILSND